MHVPTAINYFFELLQVKVFLPLSPHYLRETSTDEIFLHDQLCFLLRISRKY